MYRTFLSAALIAAIALTGCGGSGKSDKSNEGGAGAGASTPSSLPANQQAQVGLSVDIAQLLKDEATASMLKSNPELPPFVASLDKLSAFVALPGNMFADPSEYNFYVNCSFANAEDCKAAFDEMFKEAPATDVEKAGKTFKKIAEPGGPTLFVTQDGNSIVAYSEAYLDSGADSFATEALRGILNGEPKGEPFKMGIDIQGASEFLSGVGAMAPQAEAFTKAKTLMTAGGGTGDLLFMLAIDAPDEDTAKKMKSTLQLGLATIMGLASSQMPSEEVAPATNEFVTHVMSNLKPAVEGNTVKIVVNKPEGYEEMKKKMAGEAEKIQEEMMKRSMGGPGGPAGFPAGPGPEFEKK